MQAGSVRPQQASSDAKPSEDRKHFDRGGVRLTTGNVGTEIKWHVQTPCIGSLFAVMDWVTSVSAPYALRFYLSGWFEEFYQTPKAVIERLDAIIRNGDRHFPISTFIYEIEPSEKLLTPLLSDCFDRKISPDSYAIDCVLDETSQRFVVERVGENSPIAKFYGVYPSSFPCQAGSYGDMVAQGYRHVLNSGKPRADHVLAAFRLPDNQIHWVPYHRLILPLHSIEKRTAVSVISQISPISFKVI